MSNDAPRSPLEEIYQEHRAALKGYISRRVRWQEEAEDILQDVFYRLARVDLVATPVEQISAWLYTTARNRIIDRARRRKEERLPARDDNETLEALAGILDEEDNSPLSALLKSLFWEELHRALEELPDGQRTVFELTEIDGFSFKELSASTGIPVNTLLSRKHHAVIFLRKRLQQLYREIAER
ncbi:MAG: RNA polymerase sigma factor [Odoribacteraceae bacterium]|jgi:RNA polymerase sigma factor (sigma-70 family)|nr:RNA polymerase sigma factor [Odoribacteraceae bacterium]